MAVNLQIISEVKQLKEEFKRLLSTKLCLLRELCRNSHFLLSLVIVIVIVL